MPKIQVLIRISQVLVFALAAWFLLGAIQDNSAIASTLSDDPVAVYFFWGDGCPHCEDAKPFLADLAHRYPQIVIRDFEVWRSPENLAHLRAMAARLDFEPRAVPTFIIGNRHWVGFSDQLAREMERHVAGCVASLRCPDAGAGIIPGVEPPALPQEPDYEEPLAESPQVLALPLVGEIDLGAQSLLFSTALIAFVDGFNPCSLWVLSVLIALTLHTGSRKKVLIIGFTFLAVTAAVYVIFIAGLFTVLSIIGFLGWIQILMAAIALVFALINIKDYFWFQEGISLTIADDKKPGIYQRARRVLNASDSLWGMVGATILLAVGVAVVEFGCTAGFPVIWTNLLASQNASPATFAWLLALYMVIYLLDEIAIFLAAVITLRAGKLEEKFGRILKLVGGMLMLTLAVVLIIDPTLMNELRNSLLIFGAAFLATALVLVVHRWVLPRFGVHLGTELAGPGTRRRRKPLKGTRQR